MNEYNYGPLEHESHSDDSEARQLCPDGIYAISAGQPRPEQGSGELMGSASVCECSHPRSAHILSTGPRDRCSGTTERGTPCGCPKYTLRKSDADTPAAPERDEWYTDSRRSTDATIYGRKGNQWIGQVHGRYADQIVTEHNQHSTLIAQRDQLTRILLAACSTLKSYQYGNVSPELMKEMIRTIEQVLTTIEQESGREGRR